MLYGGKWEKDRHVCHPSTFSEITLTSGFVEAARKWDQAKDACPFFALFLPHLVFACRQSP